MNMATKNSNKRTETEDTMTVDEQKQITLTVTEQVANELLARISKLPWDVANPLILLIRDNFKPLEEKEA